MMTLDMARDSDQNNRIELAIYAGLKRDRTLLTPHQEMTIRSLVLTALDSMQAPDLDFAERFALALAGQVRSVR